MARTCSPPAGSAWPNYSLEQTHGDRAAKAYLKILHLAARETEDGRDEAPRHLFNEGQPISFQAVEALVRRGQEIPPATEVTVGPVDPSGSTP